MVAYIDEFKDRFRVGPIRRVLAASLDCGFITPRGYRMFKSRPVSRMAARHEALARDILEIHADSFMAVYGHRKTHAQLLARGRDPAEIGRDQVMNVMRESGIRGVRRGRTPVTTKPAKGTGGRPDLVERGFEAEAPNRPHVADCFASIFLKQFLHCFSAAWAAGFQRKLHHMTAQTKTGTSPPCLYIPET